MSFVNFVKSMASQKFVLSALMIVAPLFLVAASISMASTRKFVVTADTATELVSLSKGTASTETVNGVVVTVFTPELNAGSIAMVVVGIVGVVAAAFALTGVLLSNKVA